jgi:capsular exopolysaccharide synthesis family protein
MAAFRQPVIHGQLSTDEYGYGYGNQRTGIVDYLRVARRHLWIVLALTIIGVVSGVLYSDMQVPSYESHALVEIRTLNENFLNVKDVMPVSEWNMFDDIQTQIRIMQSRTLLNRVMNRLDIRTPEDLGQRNGKHTRSSRALDYYGGNSSASARNLAMGIASRNLKIRAVGRTRIVDISYEAPDPKLSADFVNALTSEYIAHCIEMRLRLSQQTNDWINGQLAELREKLAQSEEALRRYAQRSGLVILSETNNVSEEKLRRLQEEMTRAQGDRILKEARFMTAKTAAPETVPDVLNDALSRDYQAKASTLRQERAQLSTAFTPEYSKVKRIDAEIKSVETALAQHRSALMEQIRNQYAEAVDRERLLTNNYRKEAEVLTQEGAKTVEYAMLKRELDSNRQLYDAMSQRSKEAGMASAMRASNARVIDPAAPAETPSSPNTLANAAIGFASSLMVALVVIALRERRDHSVRRPGELRIYLGMSELGVVRSTGTRSLLYRTLARTAGILTGTYLKPKPYVLQSDGGRRGHSPMSQAEMSQLVQSFRSVVASVYLSADSPGVVAVTSPNPGEGKTTIASNLAITLAALHKRVLLIDGDIYQRRLHELFEVSNSCGVTDVLASESGASASTLSAMVQETGIEGLSLLTAGTQGPHGLFQMERLQRLINEARVVFDKIVIDTPPLRERPDARVLGRCADAVILVARAGRTTREAAMAASQRLLEDGINVVGTVLNDWNPAVNPDSDHGW